MLHCGNTMTVAGACCAQAFCICGRAYDAVQKSWAAIGATGESVIPCLLRAGRQKCRFSLNSTGFLRRTGPGLQDLAFRVWAAALAATLGSESAFRGLTRVIVPVSPDKIERAGLSPLFQNFRQVTDQKVKATPTEAVVRFTPEPKMSVTRSAPAVTVAPPPRP